MPKKHKYTSPDHPIHGRKKNISHIYEDLKGVIKHSVAKSIREKYETHVTPHEKEFIDDMLGLMDDPLQVAHFFLGGHIELHGDGGAMYHEWVKKFNEPRQNNGGKEFAAPLKFRRSSHVSHGEKQGSFTTPVLQHVLFSTRKEDAANPRSEKYTWLQLENTPIKDVREWNFRSPLSILNEIRNAIMHLLDFFKYKITKRNIGAYGTSEYTEKNPLKIDVSKVDLSLSKQRKQRAEVWKEIILNKRGMDIDDELKEKMRTVGIKFPEAPSLGPNIV